METMLLIRGVPGAGKSSLAKLLGGVCCEADDYFRKNGSYKFDSSKLAEAHAECKAKAVAAMIDREPLVIVSNTSTSESEVMVYQQLAEEYGYRFVSIVVENRHGNSSVNGVPNDVVDKMKNRFSIKL